MTPLVVIPARLAATRLPDKPLADIAGLPMVVQVWHRAREADIGRVVVAAADGAIADAVRDAGGEVVLTDPAHPSGSDRVHEAAMRLDPDGRHAVVVNLQGDFPTIAPGALRACLAPLSDPEVDIATIGSPITDAAELALPQVVKAAVALRPGSPPMGRALYFSRMPMPSGDGPHIHHAGVYAYRRAALDRFVALPPGILEEREKLEQLRALEHGMRIDLALVDTAPFGVDTPADLDRARRLLARS